MMSVTKIRYKVLYFYNNAILLSIDSLHGGLWFPEASIEQNEDGHSEGAEKITGQLFEPQERRETGLQKCEDPPVQCRGSQLI